MYTQCSIVQGQVNVTLCSTYFLNNKIYNRCFLTICFCRLWFHLIFPNIDNASPFCLIVTGDFHGRCRNCWGEYVNSNAGKELDSLTSETGYAQLNVKTVSIKKDDISSIIKSNKTHGFDNISICMIQFCWQSITPPLAYRLISLLPTFAKVF